MGAARKQLQRSLLFLLLFISLGFQLGMGFPQCIIHFTDSVFKLCTTLVKVLPLCKVRLVFFTGLKLLCLGREQTQRFSLRFNLLYLGAVQPVCSLCFQGVLLVFQFSAFFLKSRHSAGTVPISSQVRSFPCFRHFLVLYYS